jgi:hydroxymethylbilane synthase
MKLIKIGTRRSLLARAQTKMIIESFSEIDPDWHFEEEIVVTSGDLKQGTSAASCGDKRDWIDVFEDRLQDGSIRLAVHCGKDIPCDLSDGLRVLSVLNRPAANDVFIGKIKADGSRVKFAELQPGAKIGTASLRRRAQLARLQPDLNPAELRGNINTRLAQLDAVDSDWSGIILAQAGISRLGVDVAFESLDLEVFVPAVNQGILAVEYLAGDMEAESLIAKLTDSDTNLCFNAEREFVRILGADCKSAVGVYVAAVSDYQCRILAEVLSIDGKRVLRIDQTVLKSDVLVAAADAARQLLQDGAADILFINER